MKTSFFLFALVLAGSTAVIAAEPDRYVLEKSGSGFVRMDRATGEMSVCTEQAGQLVCRMAADDRSALETQIDALEKRVEALEGKTSAPGGLPSDEEFEKTLTFMEKFFSRFMDIVKGFEKSDSGQPQKT